MQLANTKKRRISQLHILLYSCQVSSLAICELHNHMQHYVILLADSSTECLLITLVLSVDGF